MSAQGKKGHPRRQFIKNVGSGMLVAGLGPGLATDMGFATEFAWRDDNELAFGALDPLVDMMQQMSPDKLQVALVEKLNSGKTDLKSMTAAAALANAETFGGQDYVGYHAEMALVPAFEMSQRMPSDRQALPVLKVLYRNTEQIQATGRANKKRLKKVDTSKSATPNLDRKIRDAVRDVKMEEAEELFATIQDESLRHQLNAILESIEDDINVHRFVLAHRAVELVDVVGSQHAHTILRQCVRYCVDEERIRVSKNRPASPIRKVLPELLDRYKLLSKQIGDRNPGDEWIEEMANTIFHQDARSAADAVAAALADGIGTKPIADAISLAANLLILRQGTDPWRTHGASAGVHGTDAANAWRNMLPMSDHRHQVAGLIVSAYHTGQYHPFEHDPYPIQAHLERVKTRDAKQLLGLTDEAIRSNDQALAAATVALYGESGAPAKPMFDLMLNFAVSEDGRLHAEKYYRTVEEEYAALPDKFKWRQLIALGRVTASAYGYDKNDRKGYRAGGYEDACQLLGVDA